MTNHETDRLAFQLIEVASDALNHLYNGSLPQPLKNHIKKSFNLNKKGRPPETQVIEKEREIAIRAAMFKILTEYLKNMPDRANIESELKRQGYNLEQNYTGYIEKLAEEFRCDRSDIFRIVQKFASDMGVNTAVLQMIKSICKVYAGSNDEKLEIKESAQSLADIIGPIAMPTEAKIKSLIAIGRCQGFGWKSLTQEEREAISLYLAYKNVIKSEK